ncbi:MAG: hypothetical protein WCO85_01075 [Actinomycetes bacterium]
MSDFQNLKNQWNEILDHLLATNRIAWLAFFDARLVSLDNHLLILDFRDSEKFGGNHDFTSVRNPLHFAQLEESILAVAGTVITVQETLVI